MIKSNIDHTNKYFEIVQEYLLPGSFRFFGVLLIFVGLVVSTFYRELPSMFIRNTVALGLILVGYLCITMRYGLRVDIKQKTFNVYKQILWMKVGEEVKFHSINRFYINEVKEGSRLTSYSGQTITTTEGVYKAFMLVDNFHKVHLDTDKNLEALESRLNQYKSTLARITDQL